MITTLIIAIFTFISLILSIFFFSKIKIGQFYLSTYWLIALIGAILMIVTLRVSFKDITISLFSSSNAMNPIKILALFFSMTFISIFLEDAGFFKFLATVAVKRAKHNQIILFVILYFLISFLTIVTSNDIVILTFTPFICYFCKNAKINPLPYLISEFAAANTWSMMLIIGNPTNIYLAGNAGIDFYSYLKVMTIPTLVSGIVEFCIIFLIFRKQLKQDIYTEIEVEKVNNKLDIIIGLIHLFGCIVLLSISNIIKVDMWLISVSVACTLLIYFVVTRIIRKNIQTSILKIGKSLPWALIPFIISMFIIVISLQNQGISNEISNILGNNNTIFKYGPTSYLFSNIINNIPMSILFSTLPNFNGVEYYRAIYSSIIGSNIGAFLTPVGALAGIMFTNLLKEHKIKMSFKQFCLYGFIVSLPTLGIALIMLSLFC